MAAVAVVAGPGAVAEPANAASTSTWNVSASGTNVPGSISLTTTGSWTASASATWVTLSATSGKGNASIKVNVAPNTSTSTRTATVTVKASGTTVYLATISQAGMRVTSLSWSPGATGGTYSVTGSPNGQWTAASSASWVTVSPSSGTGAATTIRLSAGANTGTSSRSATVSVKINGVTIWVINVTQAGAAAKTLNWTPGAGGGVYSLSLTPNAAWTAESSASWVTVSPASGTGTAATLRLTASANTGTSARSATVSVKVNGVALWVVNLTQAGKAAAPVTPPPPSATTTVWNVGASGWNAPAVLSYSTTQAWTATSSAAWLTVSPASGTGSASIKVNAAANSSSEARSATVTLKVSGVVAHVVTVNQAAAPSPGTATWNVGAAGWSSPAQISWSSSRAWTATSSASWVTVSPGSGSGSATIKVDVAKNTSKAARSATVTLKDNGLTAYVVTVKQSG
ncbi:MAG: BACON domain-containing protein [Bifidobacteriaceae bacterium]|nr:BACON domain-containing protein [Bifidobacteriaceae bacterium]